MKLFKLSFLFAGMLLLIFGCDKAPRQDVTAADILGNPDYLAFSYGGYRENSREVVPSISELKDDMRILQAMGIKLLRTYNTQQHGHTEILLKTIRELKQEDDSFEMYVMLGTWIECEGAWTSEAKHDQGNRVNNEAEIGAAVRLVNEYPDIVKIIAVGNESMVQWAVNYFVYPPVILEWVNHLQDLKRSGTIPTSTWITSSDNYESWGGGATGYQTEDLAELIEAVDFISLHTYPFHDSHHNPMFWGTPKEEEGLSDQKKIEAAMERARDYAVAQYQRAADYVASLGINTPIHIGETGWASIASSSFGASGSHAADEYKEKLYYTHMRDWTDKAGMSCFYFEAFDEQWKDQGDALGSENHFGLITLDGKAKYPVWDLVDAGIFDGLTRNGNPITKTYGGDESALLQEVLTPPLSSEIGILEITTINSLRQSGDPVEEDTFVLFHDQIVPDQLASVSYPSANVKLNSWEGTCSIRMSVDGIVTVTTGTGAWWGCAMEVQSSGENLSNYAQGSLVIDMKGETSSSFEVGFQTGSYAMGTQVNNVATVGPNKTHSLSSDWKTYRLPLTDMDQGANWQEVTSLLFFRGAGEFDGKTFSVRNVYYSQE